MYNTESQATLGTIQCFTIQRHRQHWAQDNVLQSRDTGNIGHKTTFYNPETQATLGTRQCFTIQRHRQHWAQDNVLQSRDTCNIGHKTMFYKRSLRENQRDCQA